MAAGIDPIDPVNVFGRTEFAPSLATPPSDSALRTALARDVLGFAP